MTIIPTNFAQALVADTTLGEATVFTGTLRFKESLCICGKFKGEIDSTGKLAVAHGAVVEAKAIKARTVVVCGTVHGDIFAPERVEFLEGAKVYGNVKTSRLRIAAGVIFEGSCEMIPDVASYDPFTTTIEKTDNGSGKK